MSNSTFMDTVPEERLQRMQEHRDDIASALLILELIDEEDSPGTPRLANLIELGKLALGSKLEILDNLIHKREGGDHGK